MAPAANPKEKIHSENQISVRKEKRIPLTEEMKLFLRQNPVILMPTLNMKEILKTPLYKSNNYSIQNKKPQLQKKMSKTKHKESVEGARGEPRPASPSVIDPKTPCKLPETSLKGTVVDKHSLNKAILLCALSLVQQNPSLGVGAVKKIQLAIELRNTLLSKREQVVSYFKSNPLPISSTLGRKIIRSGFGRCPNPAAEVARYDKYCSTHEHQHQPAGVTHWPVANTRRAVLKRGQYYHKYTFGTRQRVARIVELTLGVSAKSFPLLNKCRGFSIHWHKMSDQDMAQAIHNLRNPAQAQDSGTAPTK